ncbi:hypothetical protein RISK_004497 [Rhodopirellula islandica]|uniref:DUF4279 domain-containing protein n=1 Tax=Rhodopirellula islandica TaxID=595434 RepID=A0A0J1BAF1_RHOIS|nr:hypothetical protein RISK_004497 [Rhodopirellula islandica]
MQNATHAGGLNEFSYCASLHISHPSLDPADVTAALGMEPARTSHVGQPHRSVPDRVYDFSHWSCELATRDGDDISTFLGRFVDLMSPHRSFLEQLSDGGAEIECFIGVFATRLCDQMYSHSLLGSLAALRVNLRFELYPADDRETSE